MFLQLVVLGAAGLLGGALAAAVGFRLGYIRRSAEADWDLRKLWKASIEYYRHSTYPSDIIGGCEYCDAPADPSNADENVIQHAAECPHLRASENLSSVLHEMMFDNWIKVEGAL